MSAFLNKMDKKGKKLKKKREKSETEEVVNGIKIGFDVLRTISYYYYYVYSCSLFVNNLYPHHVIIQKLNLIEVEQSSRNDG